MRKRRERRGGGRGGRKRGTERMRIQNRGSIREEGVCFLEWGEERRGRVMGGVDTIRMFYGHK